MVGSKECMARRSMMVHARSWLMGEGVGSAGTRGNGLSGRGL